MKIQSTLPFPLGPSDVISLAAAMQLVGQKVPAKVDGNQIGSSVIVDIEWHSSNYVILIIETEIKDDTEISKRIGKY